MFARRSSFLRIIASVWNLTALTLLSLDAVEDRFESIEKTAVTIEVYCDEATLELAERSKADIYFGRLGGDQSARTFHNYASTWIQIFGIILYYLDEYTMTSEVHYKRMSQITEHSSASSIEEDLETLFWSNQIIFKAVTKTFCMAMKVTLMFKLMIILIFLLMLESWRFLWKASRFLVASAFSSWSILPLRQGTDLMSHEKFGQDSTFDRYISSPMTNKAIGVLTSTQSRVGQREVLRNVQLRIATSELWQNHDKMKPRLSTTSSRVCELL